ncbi:serine/threonine/tyrosine-interacting protein isoform X8 [Zalophus californianus]|uniref:Serine/threonine/tyrosine-interacting protein isoform X8 n=1 Tax=Zalophus californianus TaxID=9704 RepID=A0A6P9FKK4_ZALCA|nr:serine/threonine/tyrosine-interacting protein isoform X8 [Zalophus californianus]
MEDVKLEFPSLPQCKDDAEEWTYPMRREMQEILPGLFLGPYSSAMKSKLPILQKYGITHIICIRQNIEANFVKPNFQQLFRYSVPSLEASTLHFLNILPGLYVHIYKHIPIGKFFFFTLALKMLICFRDCFISLLRCIGFLNLYSNLLYGYTKIYSTCHLLGILDCFQSFANIVGIPKYVI